MRMNLPNQITVARFFLAIVFLSLLAVFDCRRADAQQWLLDAAVVLFIVAAISDALDGYLARRQNQVTSFGRVLDPFADKLLVAGTFVMMLGTGFVDEAGRNTTGLAAWMVVVIVARELLVSGLRGFSESKGKPYAANYWGKGKMFVQSVTIPVILVTLGRWREFDSAILLRSIMIWLTVGITALSVVAYLFASRDVFAERSRE
ncbi:MAG: CDP-diacylglycerol--glycerol-3-phosphate 3-phosphatidyltransferase [Planctomycetota bacterium]